MKGRLLTSSEHDPYADFALEEAIFREVGDPTVRIWDNTLSVVVGRAQLAQVETDVEYCKETRIPIVRRFTAGGTVYNGPGNINWSFFLPNWFESEGLAYLTDARGVFKMASSVVVKALRCSGIECWFDEPNRVVAPDGKICGMAAYISKKALLCHGTLLSGANLDEVKRLTTPSPREMARRYVRSNAMEVANCGVGFQVFIRSMVATLDALTGLEYELHRPSAGEIGTARELLARRYGREDWNLGDPFEHAGDSAWTK